MNPFSRVVTVILAGAMIPLVSASPRLVAQPDLHESMSEPQIAIHVSQPAGAQPPNRVHTQPRGDSCEVSDPGSRVAAPREQERRPGRPAPRSDRPPTAPKPQGFVGPFDRQALTAKEALGFPASAVVHIESSLGECSGVLYGPNIVLTAGHCVFANHQWATGVAVSPARNAQRCPFGRSGATRLFTTRGWVEGADEAFDYGAIQLNGSIGNQTGWFGYDPTPGGITPMTPLEIMGYPQFRNNPFADPRPSVLKVVNNPSLIQPRQVFYEHDTDRGDSGAPLFTGDSLVRVVHNMGCHAQPGDAPLDENGRQCSATGSDHARLNHGVRITDRVAANLAAWRAVR